MNFTDETLIENFQRTRDPSHFKSLVRRYQDRIYNAAYRMLGDGHEAEEVVQETYIKVHNNLEKLHEQTAFAAWIFRISHNLCLDILRKKQRKKSYQNLVFDPNRFVGEIESVDKCFVAQLADSAPGPAQRLMFSEQAELIQRSIRKLPEAQRAVLILHDIEGFSYQEISTVVGANLGTVRSRLHYARQKLREALASYYLAAPTGSR